MSTQRQNPIDAADYEAALLALEDELDGERFEALNRRAVEDPAMAALLFALAQQRWALSESLARSTRLSVLADAETKAGRGPIARFGAGGRVIGWAAAIVVAASLVVAMMLMTARKQDTSAPGRASTTAASVVALDGAGTTQAGEALAEGVDVPAGMLHIESGLVELITSRGVHLTLRGPGEFELVDGMRASVRSGALAASVPHYATGYTVAAGHVRVVDLGTEFSVERSVDGLVRVDVFTGSVEATEFDAAGRAIDTHRIVAAHARIFGGEAGTASIEAPVLNTPLTAGDPGISDGERPVDTIVINPAAMRSYSDQDGLHDQPSRAEVSDGGRTVRLTGNAWKAIPLRYDIDADTVIEFECRVVSAGELIGIGLDDDNRYHTGALFGLAGRENHLPYFDYSHWAQPADDWRHVRIRVGGKTPVRARQLVLFADDDQHGAAEASFRNIRLYRDTAQSTPESSD